MKLGNTVIQDANTTGRMAPYANQAISPEQTFGLANRNFLTDVPNAPDGAFDHVVAGDPEGMQRLASMTIQTGNQWADTFNDIGKQMLAIGSVEDKARYDQVLSEMDLDHKKLSVELDKMYREDGIDPEEIRIYQEEQSASIRDKAYNKYQYVFIPDEQVRSTLDNRTDQYNIGWQAGAYRDMKYDNIAASFKKSAESSIASAQFMGKEWAQGKDAAFDQFARQMNDWIKKFNTPEAQITFGPEGDIAEQKLAKDQLNSFIMGAIQQDPEKAKELLDKVRDIDTEVGGSVSQVLTPEEVSAMITTADEQIFNQQKKKDNERDFWVSQKTEEYQSGLIVGENTITDVWKDPMLNNYEKWSIEHWNTTRLKMNAQKASAESLLIEDMRSGSTYNRALTKKEQDAFNRITEAQYQTYLQQTKLSNTPNTWYTFALKNMQTWDSVGHIPQSVSGSIIRDFNNPDPNAAETNMAAISTVQHVRDNYPKLFDNEFKKSTEDGLIAVENGLGYTEFKEIRDAGFQKPEGTFSAQLKTIKGRVDSDSSLISETSKDIFGESFDPEEIPSSLDADFDQAFENGLKIYNGNEDLARQKAISQVKSKWFIGMEDPNGDRHPMKHSPYLEYGDITKDVDHEANSWIDAQFNDYVNKIKTEKPALKNYHFTLSYDEAASKALKKATYTIYVISPEGIQSYLSTPSNGFTGGRKLYQPDKAEWTYEQQKVLASEAQKEAVKTGPDFMY